jgi:hypothetical protein
MAGANASRSTIMRAASLIVAAICGKAVGAIRSVTAPIVMCTDPQEHCSTSEQSPLERTRLAQDWLASMPILKVDFKTKVKGVENYFQFRVWLRS